MPWQVVTNPFITQNTGSVSISTTVNMGDSLGTTFAPIYSVLQATQENLKNLLSTRIGERIMQPTYGTDLYRIIFEPNNNSIKVRISDMIATAINTWLPYVQVGNLDITTAEDDPSLDHFVNIKLWYTIQGFDTNSIVIYLNNDSSVVVVAESIPLSS